jgi:hypothetical protein
MVTTTDMVVSARYNAPKVLTQPTCHQRVRMFNDLKAGSCPIIQAGGEGASQRTHVELQVNNPIFMSKNELLSIEDAKY